MFSMEGDKEGLGSDRHRGPGSVLQEDVGREDQAGGRCLDEDSIIRLRWWGCS